MNWLFGIAVASTVASVAVVTAFEKASGGAAHGAAKVAEAALGIGTPAAIIAGASMNKFKKGIKGLRQKNRDAGSRMGAALPKDKGH